MKTRTKSRRSRLSKRPSLFASLWTAARRLARRSLFAETLESRHLLATFGNPTAIVFPASGDGPATPYPSTLNVLPNAFVTADVVDVNVRLNNLTHASPQDVNLMLVGPTAANAYIMGGAGGTTTATNVTFTIDDEAATTIPDPLVAGSYQPTVNFPSPFPPPAPAPGGSALSTFDMQNPIGMWSLFANDSQPMNTGTIAGGWNLILQLGGAVTINAGGFANDGTADTFTINVTATNLQVNVDGGPVEFDEPLAGISSLTINGSDDNDTVTMTGNNNMISFPITLNGGMGTNNLSITNANIQGASTDLTAADFNGTVGITGSTFSGATSGPGLVLTNAGATTLTSVQASMNAGDGVQIMTAGTVTINGAVANNFSNNAGNGLSIMNSGAVSLTNLNANDNVLHGISLITVGAVTANKVTATGNDPGMFVSGAPSFTDTDGVYSLNDDHGIQLIDIAGDVTLTRTVANDNDADADTIGDGLNASDGPDGDSLAIGGNLVLHGVRMRGTAPGAQQHGVWIVDPLAATSLITFNDSAGPVQSNIITGNTLEGVLIPDGGTTATFTNGDYSNNGLDGINLASVSGTVGMTGLTANMNGDDGIDLDTVGNVTFGNVTASGNLGVAGDGIEISNVTTGVVFTGVTASLNADNGLNLQTAGSFSDTDGTYSTNGTHGIFLTDISGNVTLTRTIADDNNANMDATGDGVRISDGGDVDTVALGGDLVVSGGRFRNPAGTQQNGLVVDSLAGSATFQSSGLIAMTVTGNAVDGVSIPTGGVNATFTGGTYSNNGDDGIDLDTFSGTVSLLGVTANDNGDLGFEISNVTNMAGTGTVTLSDLTLAGNTTNGGDLNAVDIVNYTTDTTNTGIDDSLTVNQAFIERTVPAQQRITYASVSQMNLFTRDGDDTITVESTGASQRTTIDSGDGDDTYTINGDGLSANNVFRGGNGNDSFTLNIAADLGAAPSLFPITGLQIAGDAPSGADPAHQNRDSLTINDASGTARDLLFRYDPNATGPGAGAVDIAAGATGPGYAVTIQGRTLETVIFNGGAANDDTATILGTVNPDDITVAPQSLNSTLVFLDGSPWHGPADGDFFSAFPGTAGGGSTGPDLLLNGLTGAPLQVLGSPAMSVFSANFEAGLDGFTIDNTFGSGGGLWHQSTGRRTDGLPNHSPDFNLYYGQGETDTAGGNYDTGAANGGAILSPIIHIPAGGTSTLSFDQFRDAQTGGMDITSVSVISGGVTTTILDSDAIGGISNTTPNWALKTANLTPFAGQDIQIRFSFDTIDDQMNATEGWFIDDVNVTFVGSSIGDKLIVYAPSEQDLVHQPTLTAGFDPFGFGPGVIIPGRGVGNAYDTIHASDSLVTIVNNIDGPLMSVALDPASGFAQPGGVGFGLIINAGFESAPGIDDAMCGDGVDSKADDITVAPSFNFAILANGGDPNASFTPEGDKANLGGIFDSIDVFSDKGTPPAVTFVLHPAGGGAAPFGVGFSSIECFGAFVATTVNLIGDNNDPTVDQTDNFVVVGQDTDNGTSVTFDPDGDGPLPAVTHTGDADCANEFVATINGSFAIPFAGVQFLNVYGFDQQPGFGATVGDVPATPPGTLSPGGQDINVDTLEITACADNADNGPHPPRGWGIDVFFNEGVPNQTDGFQEDLLIYHTAMGMGGGGSVSENIILQPSGPDNGELRSTNAADGSVIVVIQYVANTDFIIVDDDGSLADTDTLTLRGTNPETPQTSGNDTFDVDFDAAGDVANPYVTVRDTNNGSILYRLRSFTDLNGPGPDDDVSGPFPTVTFDTLAGDDTLSFRTPTGGSFASGVDQVNVLAGLGEDSLTVDVDGRDLWHGGHLFYDGGAGSDRMTLQGTPNFGVASVTYNPAAIPGNGQLIHNDSLLQTIDFVNLEPVVDLIPAANLIVNATNANNSISYNQGSVATNGLVTIDDLESMEFSGKTTLTINALAGSDTINLNNPATPTGLTSIVVNGGDPTGDPTASDKVIVNGTPGADVIAFTPNGLDDATVAITGQPTMELNTTEHVIISGVGGGDTLTINGTAFDDTTVTTPAAGGSGTFRSIGSPALDFFSYATLNVNGGAGGQDIVQIDGTSANDAFTSGAASITLGGTVNIGAGISLVQVNGLAGNDTIDLSSYAATPLFVHGNDGNDIINGGTQADTLSGDDGNDTIDGNGGADQMFGNAGSDVFIWDPGDGSDLIEGGANESDILRFNGSAGAEVFALTAVGTRVLLTRNLGGINMDIAGVEQIDINALDGADSLTVNDLYPTDVKVVNLNIANAVAGADSVLVQGRNTSDVVNVFNNAGVLDVIGLRYDVHVTGAVAADGDAFTFNGNNGNDNIVSPLDASLAPLFTAANFTLTGGDGDDFISGYGTLNGDDPANPAATGKDTLVGGSVAQTINGGPDNDTIFGGGGADMLFGNAGDDTFVPGFDLAIDTIDGGTGFDTILVQGSSANDRIDARQDSPTQVRYNLLGVNSGTGVIPGVGTETDTLVAGTVEELRIEAGSGDDIIRVTQSDSLILGAQQAQSLRFTVDGGPPGASDRLTVTDDGLGDTTIQRIGGTAGNGSFRIGALAPVVYTDVEFASLNPINSVTGGTGTDGAGRLFVFKYDPYENNNDRLNSTFLGGAPVINIDPVIDPGQDGLFGLPGDEDWYRLVPQVNGDLDIRVLFRQQGVLSNGRAGLPGNGDLDIALYDADGLPLEIAGTGAFGTNDTNDDERIRIPAVAGQTYFLRIKGAGLTLDTASDAVNVYSLQVLNTAAPVPFDLELEDNNPISTVSVGGATSFSANLAALPSQPLSTVDGFYIGKYVTFTASPAPSSIVGERALVTAYTAATRTFTFAAGSFSAAIPVGATFIVESNDTGRSNSDNITRDNTPQIFLRVPNVINVGGVANLDDVPNNGSAPGSPPDGAVIGLPFVNSLLLDAPAAAAGFRVAIFVTEKGTSDLGPPNNVLAGYAQPVDPVNRPGVFSFTFGSAGSFIPNLSPDGSYFISARVEIIDPTNPQQNQGYGDYAQSLEITVDTIDPPISFGDPGVAGDGFTADSDSFVIPNPETVFDQITNDLTPTFWGRAEADSIVQLYADTFRDTNGNGVFDFTDVNGNGVFDAGDIAIDIPPDGIFQPNLDLFIGQTTAIPIDGNQQDPWGYWDVESVFNFNDPRFFVNIGGARTVFATAEDQAGNFNDETLPQQLQILIDVQGPQITDVDINTVGNTYQLFDPKPTSGPTPLVNSLVISVQDLPPRLVPMLVSPAFKADVADNPGHYRVTGDYNGVIPILDIIPVLNPIVNNQPATGTITIVFRTPGPDGVFNTADDVGAPLPDDRFTLHIDDTGIIDFANNKLDGESNAAEPHQQGAVPPILGVDGVPTGDGIPGGDFNARFTVDSRPEVGVWAGGSAWIDTNGNDHFDQNNVDFTNRDITYMLGLTSDDLFAGNFATTPIGAPAFADGFDKLAAYGKFNGSFRWLVDTDNDGIPNVEHVDPAQVNGLPVAGNFGPFAGDEVGLFTGTTWRFDTNHNFELDNTLAWPTPGYPVVGDFDGDGLTDLATWTDDTFSIDLSSVGAGGVALPGNPGINGTIDRTFKFGFIGVGERPVARDMNMDGMTDLGLFVPARDGVPPTDGAEWYFLISGVTANDTPPGSPAQIGPSITGGQYPSNGHIGPGSFQAAGVYGLTASAYTNGRIVDDPLIAGPGNIVRFNQLPFGHDQYVQFGSTVAVPILGNFDPPATLTGTVGSNQTESGGDNGDGGGTTHDPLDVNGDGSISPLDALVVINYINNGGDTTHPVAPASGGPYLDVNDDTFVSPLDALMVINYLNNLPAGGEGEGESAAADAVFTDYNPYANAAETLLNLIASDDAAKKKK